MTGQRLAGRVALVTGASRGIGAAIARRFAAEGAHIVALARTQGALEEVDDQIRAAGGNATLVVLDLTEPDRIDAMAHSLFERFGRLDILVGNAGLLGGLRPVGDYDPKTWDTVFAINVNANWRLIRALDPLLRRSEAGRAIFVTSRAAEANLPYFAPYSASKAALNSLVLTWAAEVGRITNIKINLVNPGIVATRMHDEIFPGDDPATVTPPEAITDLFVSLAEASSTAHGQLFAAQETKRPETA